MRSASSRLGARYPLHDVATDTRVDPLLVMIRQTSEWDFPYRVTAAQLAVLASAPLEAIRTNIAGRTQTVTLPTRRGQRIMSAAACFVDAG